MLYKKSNIKSASPDGEKYIFGVLIFTYIVGVCSGCYLVFSNSKNLAVTEYLVSKNPFLLLLYFLLALVLKYSGILSSLICLLPAALGLQNAIYYCSSILQKSENIFPSLLTATLKDTSVSLLLIIYTTLIAFQIISKRYNIRNDLKYLAVYIMGIVSISAIDYALSSFIF